jgi:hypothetical protein
MCARKRDRRSAQIRSKKSSTIVSSMSRRNMGGLKRDKRPEARNKTKGEGDQENTEPGPRGEEKPMLTPEHSDGPPCPFCQKQKESSHANQYPNIAKRQCSCIQMKAVNCVADHVCSTAYTARSKDATGLYLQA